MTSQLGHAIDTVVALCGGIDDSPHKYMMIKDGLGFASRSFYGERNMLIIEKSTGSSIVLTGNMLKKFNLEMSVFGWDENGNVRDPRLEIKFKGTPEEADILHNEIIAKYFDLFIKEEDEIRVLQGKPTIQEERIMKKTLQERNAVLQSLMKIIDDKINNLQKELDDNFERDWNQGTTALNYKSQHKIVKSIHDLCDEHDVLRWEFEKNETELYYM
jgi:hypothetical protein